MEVIKLILNNFQLKNAFKFFEKLRHRPLLTPLDERESLQQMRSRGYFKSIIHNISNVSVREEKENNI